MLTTAGYRVMASAGWSGGSVHARFQERYLTIEECQPQPRQPQPARVKPS